MVDVEPQQLETQLPPMGQTCVAWQYCGQVPADEETQAPPEQMLLSGQSRFCVHPVAQRGWLGTVVVSQPWPSGQSDAVTHPTAQLFEPSGFDWQICPF